jgi:hypothetical protein|tara:strand:+ start:3257 stop:3466 length:210 start_codon:yes stop_codon:yes gene_type:complete
MKNILLPTEEKFIELIEEYKWEEAARMYYDWAYKHRDSFNRILNERNRKDKVLNILRELDEYGEHNDQI